MNYFFVHKQIIVRLLTNVNNASLKKKKKRNLHEGKNNGINTKMQIIINSQISHCYQRQIKKSHITFNCATAYFIANTWIASRFTVNV